MSADFTPEKEDIKILTPFKMQVLTNFPYIEADFDALTNYQLLCKIVEYLNNVIHNENEVSEEVIGLYNAYVALQKYVNDYFDNLDLQPIVDNKLDQMAEDGTLADMIAEYIKMQGQLVYNSVADMKAAENIQNGSFLKTYGYYSYNDGGGSLFKARTITNEDVIDDASIIALKDETLVAELIPDIEINVDQFGAKGDGTTDDSTNIQKAIDYITNNKITKTLAFSPKTYYINNTLNLTRNIILKGASKTMYNTNTATILVRKNNIVLLNLKGSTDWTDTSDSARASDIIIENLTLLTDSEEYFTNPLVYTWRAIYNQFNNVIFRGNGKAVFMDLSTFDSKFNNCDFIGDSDIETVDSYDTDYYSAVIHGTNQILFYGCRFEGFTKGNILKFGNYTREMFFFGTKFEGTPSDTNPILTTKSNNGDIYMYGTRVTLLEGSDSYLANLINVKRSLFDISYVDNSLLHTNPLLKIDNTSNINMLLKVSLDKTNYPLEYYIDNINDNQNFDIDTNIDKGVYYTSKKLYSNPELMNKSNVILDNVYSSNVVNDTVQLKLRKSTESSPSIWKLLPNYNSFVNNVTQLNIVDPSDNVCAIFRNGGMFAQKRFGLPYLTTAPTGVYDGDILINAYTDNATPNLSIGVNNTIKRIGWGASAPASGYWTVGNIVYNNYPTPGGVLGWVCTGTGTPGTWKSFGNIEA